MDDSPVKLALTVLPHHPELVPSMETEQSFSSTKFSEIVNRALSKQALWLLILGALFFRFRN